MLREWRGVARLPSVAREGGQVHMSNRKQDNPGIRVPPPLIYLLPLVLGLLLDRRFHVPFLPRSLASGLGWSLLASGLALTEWFRQTMRRAGAPIPTDKPVPRLTTDG